MTKFVIFGLGAVGSSFLRIIKENNLFDANNWFVIDKNETTIEIFENVGGYKKHFTYANITKNNYDIIFSKLKSGDYLLDFSSSQTNTDLLTLCMKKNIHYLSTSSLPYEPDGIAIPDYHDFNIYKELKKKSKPNTSTSIIEFGMNPGMVSCFMKQCIKEIVKNDTSSFVEKNRDILLSLISQNNYAKVAQMLEIEIIHISDIDTTRTNISPEKKYIYSTWNVESFADETLNKSEVFLGINMNLKNVEDNTDDLNINDGYLRLKDISINYIEQTYSPWGSFDGYIVPHEEIYSIGNFLSVYDNDKDKILYKPSVYFVYLPCEIAVNSLLEYYQNKKDKFKEYLIHPQDILSGGEAVGVVIEGKNFNTHYFGNKLVSPIKGETPTILQVSSSAYSAFRFMLKNPNLGFIFPEEVDDEEILKYAKKYQIEYTSFDCPKLKRIFFKQFNISENC